ncbi:MAG: phosphate ABC transporter permease PstA [Phycisphaerae bacterium]
MTLDAALFRPRLNRRRHVGRLFAGLFIIMTFFGMAVLSILIYRIVQDGWPWLSWKLIHNFPSVLFPREAGVKSALWGTLWMIALTILFAVPTGIGAAVYLEEFAPKHAFVRLIQINIANLAGVPSIVYGMLGLAVFVRFMEMGRSVLAGAMTMSLLILPVIVIASQQALAAVPQTMRHAALALGATRWQVVWSHVLPAAAPGIVTGVLLSVSRALGETAPLIMIGALSYVAFVPEGPLDEFTVMPIQIYDWCVRPQEVFHHLAASAIVVLLGGLLLLNMAAIGIRLAFQRNRAW